jgi:hypothetical protein
MISLWTSDCPKTVVSAPVKELSGVVASLRSLDAVPGWLNAFRFEISLLIYCSLDS